jgi:hypothetical protein
MREPKREAMRTSRACLGATLALACGLWSVSARVRADERTDARREFRAGMQDVADGKYDEGVEHLERAYDSSTTTMEDRPPTLRPATALASLRIP